MSTPYYDWRCSSCFEFYYECECENSTCKKTFETCDHEHSIGREAYSGNVIIPEKSYRFCYDCGTEFIYSSEEKKYVPKLMQQDVSRSEISHHGNLDFPERNFIENGIYALVFPILTKYETRGYNAHQRTQNIAKEIGDKAEEFVRQNVRGVK